MGDKSSYNYLIMLPYSKILGATIKPMSVDDILEQLKIIDKKVDYINLKEDQQQFLRKLCDVFYNMLLDGKMEAKEYAVIKTKLVRLKTLELDTIHDVIIDSLLKENSLQRINAIVENFARLRSFSNKLVNCLDSEFDIDTFKLIIKNKNFQELVYRTYDEQFNYLNDKEELSNLHDINKHLLFNIMYEQKNKYYKHAQESKDIVRTFYVDKYRQTGIENSKIINKVLGHRSW